jgi:hypothetical protein
MAGESRGLKYYVERDKVCTEAIDEYLFSESSVFSTVQKGSAMGKIN